VYCYVKIGNPGVWSTVKFQWNLYVYIVKLENKCLVEFAILLNPIQMT